MDAVVMAGGTPAPGEPLYPYTQGRPKAMLEIAGKPMIQWVLDALCDSESIQRVVLVGLEDETGLTCDKLVARLKSAGDLLPNIRIGVEELVKNHADVGHVALVSSDIPGITSEHVDWMVNTAMQTDHDIYYGAITREVMEARYPDSKRSFIHLRDMDVCGGDLNIARAALVNENQELWTRIIAARKNALKQAALLGYDTLLLLLLRMITLEGAVKKVTKRLKVTGRVLLTPYAELGMDVDKPHQLELMQSDLARR